MVHRKHIAWRGPIIAKAIADTCGLGRIVEVGGGIGDIAAALADLGAEVWILENSDAAVKETLYRKDRYIYIDITKDLLTCKYDLVLCFEVLSILPEETHAKVIENLAALGNRILCNHVPAIPGYQEREEVTESFRQRLAPWGQKQAFKALYRTATYFEKLSQ